MSESPCERCWRSWGECKLPSYCDSATPNDGCKFNPILRALPGASAVQIKAALAILTNAVSFHSELVATHMGSPLYEAMHGSNVPVDEWEYAVKWVEVKVRKVAEG